MSGDKNRKGVSSELQKDVENFDKSELKRTNSEDSADHALDVAKTHLAIENNKNLAKDLNKISKPADDKAMIDKAKIQYAIDHGAASNVELNHVETKNRSDEMVSALGKSIAR